jgi:hypothetical protein
MAAWLIIMMFWIGRFFSSSLTSPGFCLLLWLTTWLGSESESESESELLYDWRFTAIQSVLATSSFRLKTSNFIFWLNTCGYGPYVTSSLLRGWVCRLQSPLVLASAVIFRSESSGTHDHILLPQIWDSSNLEGQVPIFISPRNRVASLYLRYCVPFLLPSMTHWAKTEVFEHASTRNLTWFFSKWLHIWCIGILGNVCWALITWKHVQYWPGLQDSTSMEVCLSTCSLGMGPHVKICFLHFNKICYPNAFAKNTSWTDYPCFMFGIPNRRGGTW